MNSKPQQQKITIYEANATLSFNKIIKEIVCDIKPTFELGYQLAKRDIQAAYRQSILGILWAFLLPLITSGIWILLNGSKTISIENSSIPYPAFVLIGTLLWQTLAESVIQPLKSVISGKSILSKLNFPRESLLAHALFTVAFNSILKIPIILSVLIIFNLIPGWSGLAFVPLLIGLILFGMTIGLIVLPVGMIYGDISRILPLVMQFLMFLTPVIYPLPKQGLFHSITHYNPFAYFIESIRSIITGQEPYFIIQCIVSIAISLTVLYFGIIVYRFIMPILIERVGS